MKYLWPLTAIALAVGLYILHLDTAYLLDERTRLDERLADAHDSIRSLAVRQSDLEAVLAKKEKPRAAHVPKGSLASVR